MSAAALPYPDYAACVAAALGIPLADVTFGMIFDYRIGACDEGAACVLWLRWWHGGEG